MKTIMDKFPVKTSDRYCNKLFITKIIPFVLFCYVSFTANTSTKLSDEIYKNYGTSEESNSSYMNNLLSDANKISQQQKKKITGEVFDTANLPIIGANIIESGTSNGTITDVNGNFSLEVNSNAIIHISYIGYLDQDVNVGGKTNLHIILQEDTKTLEEIVVVGYGTMRKSDLTGSISTIKEDLINLGLSTSPEQALRGKISGVQITNTSGQPGAGTIIRVRGTTSILGSNEPLYVIDGIPVSGGGAAAGLSGRSVSPLTTINPSDIESMEILKDASATAIYGSRGANGVIMITTRQGKLSSTFNANLNVVYGTQEIDHMIELTSPQEWAELWNESMDYKNFGLGKYDIDDLPAETNWQKAVYRTAPLQRYELSFSGGTEKLKYMLSGGFTTQDGVIINTDFKRYSLRTNIENIFSNWLTVGTNISATRIDSNQAGDGGLGTESPISRILVATPIIPIYKEDGSYEQYVDIEGKRENPYASIKEMTNNDVRNRFLSNLYANITFIPGLIMRPNFAIDYVNSNSYAYVPSYIAEGRTDNGSATMGTRNQLYWNFTNTLSYVKTFNEIHSITGMLGLEYQKSEVIGNNARGTQFTNDNAKYYNLGQASVYTTNSSYSAWQMESYFARFIYSLQNKYILTLTGRVDGSSRFGDNNKYARFPSAAFAWRLKEENFLKDIQFLSNLKLRSSYGVSGEQGIPLYQTFSSLNSNTVWMDQVLYTGFYPARSADPNLRWEKTRQFDFGIDAGFFDNRLNLTIDIYQKLTTDLLYRKALPPTSGFQSMLKNIGSTENKGLEISADAYIIDNKNFKWFLNVNNSWNRNKVLELGDDRNEIINPSGGLDGGDLKSWPSILRVGEPLGILYGYLSDGVIYDEAEAEVALQMGQVLPFPGELKIVDVNKDGTINDEDKVIIADANPDFTGGMTNSLNYKNFQLDVLMQWVYGNDILNYQHLANQRLTLGYNATKEWYDHRWTPENPNRLEPRAGYDVRAYTDVSYHVFDGSYLRVNNVTLSYFMPKSFLNKIKLKSLKLSAMVDNLYTFTNYKGWTPDISSMGDNVMGQGVDSGTYPVPRTISFGINIGF